MIIRLPGCLCTADPCVCFVPRRGAKIAVQEAQESAETLSKKYADKTFPFPPMANYPVHTYVYDAYLAGFNAGFRRAVSKLGEDAC